MVNRPEQLCQCRSVVSEDRFQKLTLEQNCEREHEEITSNLQAWCERLMGLHFEVQLYLPIRAH